MRRISLCSEVEISDAKNSVLSILAGCLLTQVSIVIENVFHLNEEVILMKLLRKMSVNFTASED